MRDPARTASASNSFCRRHPTDQPWIALYVLCSRKGRVLSKPLKRSEVRATRDALSSVLHSVPAHTAAVFARPFSRVSKYAGIAIISQKKDMHEHSTSRRQASSFLAVHSNKPATHDALGVGTTATVIAAVYFRSPLLRALDLPPR